MSQVTVIQATYGASAGAIEVTQRVQTLIDGGATSITANNNNLCPGQDPAKGSPKYFTMIYRVGQTTHTVACRENDEVGISVGGKQVVVDAVYGATGGTVDVKALVQALIDSGTTQFVPDQVPGIGDPAYGSVKSFGLVYIGSDGQRHVVTCSENDTVKLA